MKLLFIAILVGCAFPALAQPIQLAPGETLVASSSVCPKCGKVHATQAVSSDQAQAQAEANYMASRGIRGHVWGCIGNFEGVGWSSGGMPSTCTPRRRMRLVADAIARGRGGVYRVRAWR